MGWIAPNWYIIEGIKQDFLGEAGELNICVGVDSKGLVLIDTGMPGTINLIEKGLKPLNKNLSDIKTVIATHCHPNHIGNLQILGEKYGISIGISGLEALEIMHSQLTSNNG